MDRIDQKLTVFFEDPFWVGVFERVCDGKLTVCKVTFGAEPKDYEVLDFILKRYVGLKFSPAVPAEARQAADRPKRRQREIQKQLRNSGVGTKSQQALQARREEMKTERERVSKEQREAEKKRRFQQKQQKRKEKHKGH